MNKRGWILAAMLGSSLLITTAQAGGIIDVIKSAGCSCCAGWISQLEKAGFTISARDVPMSELNAAKRAAGLGDELASCHTGRIAGYVIEGHVPEREIRRLISERPDAIGLTVPGMPLGSPGMEAGDDKEPYEVLLVRKDGSTEVFARY